jgi:hypothetical protein
MEDQSQLVIHAGELMPVGRAWILMTDEFSPYGYSNAIIWMLIKRAYQATQQFLRQLTYLPASQKKDLLDEALKNDAKRAVHWRSTSRTERELHAMRLEADQERLEAQEEATRIYFEEASRRDNERRTTMREAFQQEQAEIVAGQLARDRAREKASQEYQKALRQAQWKAEWEAKFERWQAQNKDRWVEGRCART